jgi:esterase/lipase
MVLSAVFPVQSAYWLVFFFRKRRNVMAQRIGCLILHGFAGEVREVLPLARMLQFRRLLHETKQILPDVTCPYSILQGEQDDTVQAVSAEHLRQRVGSTEVTIDYFPRSGHLILHGPEADDAIGLIVDKMKLLSL